MNKLCECGCGQPAPIAPRTHTYKGIVKGQPYRFIAGHQNRKPRPEPPLPLADGTHFIPLTKGKFAMVDEADHEWLSRWVWFYHNGYAARAVGSGACVFMHNAIMDTPSELQVDHINLNRIDNRRRNLRLCTVTQNLGNMRSKKGTSKYKGVSWVNRDSQWLAQIQYKYKTRRIGQFDIEVDAARAYDKEARRLFGEFARCNFQEVSDERK